MAFKVQVANATSAVIAKEIEKLISEGLSPMRRDSETDLPDGTVAKGTVVNKTIIVDREGAKSFFTSVRAKTKTDKLFSFICPPEKVAECDEGAEVQCVVKRDTKGVGRFQFVSATAVKAVTQDAPQVNEF